MTNPSQVIIGTAGHIDHGKTSIVKALTGTDTDRLKEEKKRGMTIDIGFAYLNDDITIIDVPGHEKFIKNKHAVESSEAKLKEYEEVLLKSKYQYCIDCCIC